jgi:hypothetical protein
MHFLLRNLYIIVASIYAYEWLNLLSKEIATKTKFDKCLDNNVFENNSFTAVFNNDYMKWSLSGNITNDISLNFILRTISPMSDVDMYYSKSNKNELVMRTYENVFIIRNKITYYDCKGNIAYYLRTPTMPQLLEKTLINVYKLFLIEKKDYGIQYNIYNSHNTLIGYTYDHRLMDESFVVTDIYLNVIAQINITVIDNKLQFTTNVINDNIKINKQFLYTLSAKLTLSRMYKITNFDITKKNEKMRNNKLILIISNIVNFLINILMCTDISCIIFFVSPFIIIYISYIAGIRVAI